MPRIDRLYAFICEDPPGSEGIIATFNPEFGWAPMVGADMERMDSMRAMAEAVQREVGKPVTLAIFSTRADIETLS